MAEHVVKCNRCKGRGFTWDGPALVVGTIGVIPLLLGSVEDIGKKSGFFRNKCCECKGEGYRIISTKD